MFLDRLLNLVKQKIRFVKDIISINIFSLMLLLYEKNSLHYVFFSKCHFLCQIILENFKCHLGDPHKAAQFWYVNSVPEDIKLNFGNPSDKEPRELGDEITSPYIRFL
jgi:hypothetical protein